MSKEIANVLDAAADRLSRPDEWGQGAKGGGNATGSCCAALAILDEQGDPAWEAREFFAKFLGGIGVGTIWAWNDDPARTVTEVVYNLRAAAMLARGDGPEPARIPSESERSTLYSNLIGRGFGEGVDRG